MFAVERHRLIRRYLEEHNQAEVHSLSSLLSISEVTVRRDLERLESEGFLERTHGGAILREDRGESDASACEDSVKEYSNLVESAMRLIQNGDSLLLSSGLILRELADKLSSRSGCTVLTNDLLIAAKIASQKQNRCVFLGGDVDPQDLACYDPVGRESLAQFHVRFFFTEIEGLDQRLALSSSSRQRALFIQQGKRWADEVVFMAASERLSRSAFFYFGEAKPGDTLITDPGLEDTMKRTLFATNVRLFTSINLAERNDIE